MSEPSETVAARLNTLLAGAGLDRLDAEAGSHFAAYCALLLRWNARMNLTAVRDEEGILSRHFVECIACARALPTEVRTLLDFGAGAGFPGIPIALCRPEIAVTLAESQGKKAAFLQEAVRTLGISAKVHSGRAEALPDPFDCVSLRAVDHMEVAIPAAAVLVKTGGWLVVMTTESAFESVKAYAGAAFSWVMPVPLPGGESRVLTLGRREVSSPA